jgi:hypothetical protein
MDGGFQINPGLLAQTGFPKGFQIELSLTDLELTSKSARRLRDDHEDRTAKFLRSLSSLIHLRNFCMVNVPFFETTIVGRVVEVAKLLSNLRIFHFLPVPVTSRPKDQLVLGNLHLLEKLTRDNTNLRFVETPVCIGDGPVPAAEEVPGEHPLEKLSIPATVGRGSLCRVFRNDFSL